MVSTGLSPSQLHALFDILTHHETYSEIENFKHADATANYGFPFVQKRPGSEGSEEEPVYANKSMSPILQLLFRRFVLTVPPAKKLPSDFWSVKIQGLLVKFAEAGLSESYEKGAMGTRKTLTTASSALIETVARGCLGGYPREGRVRGQAHKDYDLTSARDLELAWDDLCRDLIYGDLLDDLYDFFSESMEVEEHSPKVAAGVEYAIILLGAFLHHVFIVSADGQYLLKLIENVHKLLPYSVIKQTLRVSNAATMINGMSKLLLAKLSVGSVSNWLGLTQNADDGVNLLQRIISVVLSWDSSEFRKSADKIEKTKGGPTKDQLNAIKKYVSSPLDERDRILEASIQKRESIVVMVLREAGPKLAESLTDETHTSCLNYLSALLSVRDRDEITKVLCRQNPDIFTQAIRDGVAACEPLIRDIHDKVDLREPISDMESFIGQFIETGKRGSSSTKDEASVPTVKDYVELLRRNKKMVYKWLHNLARECPDIREMFREWAKNTIKVFRTADPNTIVNGGEEDDVSHTKAVGAQESETDTESLFDRGAGAMDGTLSNMFSSLPEETRASLIPLLDSHAQYLSSLSDGSSARMQRILDQVSGKEDSGEKEDMVAGPGLYLSRWQNLLDETLITPDSPQGKPRHGRDVKHVTTQGKTGADGSGSGSKGGSSSGDAAAKLQSARKALSPGAPDVSLVVEKLGDTFHEYLSGLGQ